MAIPPEVFPTLSAVVRTRADWDAVRRARETSSGPFQIAYVAARVDAAADDLTSADSDDIVVLQPDFALQSRQDQLIEAASAISASVNTVDVRPTLMAPLTPVWQQPGARILFGFNALVLVAAVMVSVLSYRNLTATRDVAALMDRVNEVGSIEARIAAKLDQSNVGVQTLINETNSRISFLQTQVSNLPADTKGIVKELGNIAKDMLKIPEQLANAQQFHIVDEGDAPVAARPRAKRVSVRNTNVASADIVRLRAPKPLPAASKAFRRVVGEDGSVRFEKIR